VTAWQLLETMTPMVREKDGAAVAAMKAVLLPSLPEVCRSEVRKLDLDEPFEWPFRGGSFCLPLRAVTDAIDTNDEEVVLRVRQSLRILEKRSPAAYSAVLNALTRHDDSYRRVLVRTTKPVVVDGSNVAWYGEERGGRARVAYLRAVRRELRGAGYFPIRVFIDASLFYQIDQPHCLEQMVARGEVICADAGRDADEQILNEARDLGAAVVSNDRMQEHDPQGLVRKLRFEVSEEGAIVCAG
ncbi:MAG: hypothetical protein QHJ73_18710, partial [Armatimonadota bacterium]|nr:hypothetical protein [Armatimonadota bacterium]